MVDTPDTPESGGVSGKRVLLIMLVLIILFSVFGGLLIQCAERDLGPPPPEVRKTPDE